MSRKNLRYWGAAAIPVAVLSVAVVVACTDVTGSDSPGTQPDDALMTRAAQSSSHRASAAEHLAARNKHSWVGRSHNKALDAIRDELRRPGVLSRNLCSYMMDFITHPDRIARSGGPRGLVAPRAAAKAGMQSSAICRNSDITRTASWMSPLSARLQEEEYPISDATRQLLADVNSAVENAADANDLAARLHPVLDAAGALPEIERVIVESTVSTAQYSFEYWSVELPAFQTDLWNEYGGCATQYHGYGYDSESARSICMSGDVRATSLPPSYRGAPMLILTSSAARECGLASNYKKLAGSDAIGAATGAVKAAVFGPPGVAAGAFGGGALASFGQFLKSTWDLYWCAM
jgi:hypothetical protein